jgi:hypothetical protein
MKTALIQQHTATDKQQRMVMFSNLGRTGSCQLREATDAATVARYAEAYAAKVELPPIVLFTPDDGATYFIGDGHHRLAGARRAAVEDSIWAIVKHGDRRAAILYAAGANGQHGLPLTNDDKRKMVTTLLADEEWRQWSDRQIAEHCHVSANFVGSLRKKTGAESTTRKGKDGRTTTPKPARHPKPAPTTEPETLTPASDDVDTDPTDPAGDQVLHRDRAPTRPPAAAPALAPPLPSAAPVAQRRMQRLRHLVAQRLIHDKPRWVGSDRSLAALILLLGVDSQADRYDDALLGHAQASLETALAHRCAAELTSGDHRMPDVATLARLWALDPDALAIQAEREEPA